MKYQQVTRVQWLSAVQYRPLYVTTAMSAGRCLVEVPTRYRISVLFLRLLIIILTQYVAPRRPAPPYDSH